MIRIIVDSASDMPKEIQERYGILSVPLQVTIGDEHYRDWQELAPDELYRRLDEEDVVPVTAQPLNGDWYPVLDGCRERGEQVIILTLSSALSGTHSGAVLAAGQYPDLDIRVLDARTASLGVSAIAMELAKARDAGASLDELVHRFEQLNARIHTYVVVGDMEMLRRGGRIGGASAMLAGMLNIKPVLRISEEGTLEPLEKVRGWKRARALLVELYRDYADRDLVCGVAHGRNQGEMKALAEAIGDIDAGVQPVEMEIGAVIGSHVGPGTVGLVFFDRV